MGYTIFTPQYSYDWNRFRNSQRSQLENRPLLKFDIGSGHGSLEGVRQYVNDTKNGVSRDLSEIDANDTNTRNIESQFNYGKNGWESKSQAVNGNWNQNAANFGATPELVKAILLELNRLGYLGGNGLKLSEDGKWGINTQKAYQDYVNKTGALMDFNLAVANYVKPKLVSRNLNGSVKSNPGVESTKPVESTTPTVVNNQRMFGELPNYTETSVNLPSSFLDYFVGQNRVNNPLWDLLKTTGQFYQTESDTTPQSSTSFTTNKTEETTASPYKALDSWYYSIYSAKKAFNENYKQGIIESLRKQGKNNKEIYNELNNIFNIWFNQNYKKQNGTVFGPIYKRN